MSGVINNVFAAPTVLATISSYNKMASFNRWFTWSVMAAVLSLFAGCYEHRSVSVSAYLRNYKSDSLEIEIPYQVEGQGNVHNFDLKKYTYISADWIYLAKRAATVPADSLILCDERGKTSYPGPQSDLRGEILMNDTVLTIHFKLPYYNWKGYIKKWTNYEFNGNYKLITLTH